MTDNVENILIEMLNELRNEVKALRHRHEEDMDDIKARISSLESAMASVRRDVNHGGGVDDSVRQNGELDELWAHG